MDAKVSCCDPRTCDLLRLCVSRLGGNVVLTVDDLAECDHDLSVVWTDDEVTLTVTPKGE